MTISFDGSTKLATLSTGTTTLNVADLWSRWCDWLAVGTNSKWRLAMEQVGGNAIDVAAGTSIPAYIYLLDGWRVRPQEASHTLAVTSGVLLVAGGGDPFVDTLGSHVVRVNYQQPVQAITVTASGSGLSTAQDLRLERLEQMQRNKRVLNRTTGMIEVMSDNGLTVLFTAPAFKDEAGLLPYDGSGAVHRTERLA